MIINSRLASADAVCRRFATAAFASILLAAPMLLALTQTAFAATYTVCQLPAVCDYETPDDAVNDPGIVDGDIINVTADSYVLGSPMQIVNNITINGNGAVLNANGDRALELSGTSAIVTVNDVNIYNGQSPGESSGGAISVTGGAHLTLNGSSVENSSADSSGGGLSNINSTVDILDSAFIGNDSGFSGGAIRTFGATAVTNLTRVTVDSNQSGVLGGGIAATGGGTFNVFESTISNNVALTSSVIIDNFTPTDLTTNCGTGPYGQTFLPGTDVISAFYYRVRVAGGGIPTGLAIPGRLRKDGPGGPLLATTSAILPAGLIVGDTPVLVFVLDSPIAVDPSATYAIETEIIGNYSVFGTSAPGSYPDGQAYNCSAVLSDDDYDFQILGGTPGDGGGAYSDGTIILTNSTVSENIGDGAIASTNNSSVTAEYSTLVNNSGNGLAAKTGESGGVIFLGSTILAGNGGDDCSYGFGTFTISAGFNLIGDGSGCNSLVLLPSDQVGSSSAPIDPLLGGLQDNGGPTFTHALDPGSPAVDAGGDCVLVNDQRGVERPQGNVCDVGSFELVASAGRPLQALIDAAEPGETITIPNGTYTESITIGDGITLEATTPGNVTIDASGLDAPAITATGDFTLVGVRITGGNSSVNGGGIVAIIADTDITLTDVQFDNNAAAGNGGAIYQLNGTLNGTNVIFNNNNAVDSGGAIFSSLNLVNLQNAIFSLNTAGNAGGAIFNDGILTLAAATIDSSAADTGGGLYNNANASTRIMASTFSNNNASGEGTVGGAIGGGGTIEVSNSTLSGNTSIGGGGNGGGIGLVSGGARLNNVTLAFNSAEGLGGPFYAEAGAQISFGNSLFSDNAGGGTNCASLVSQGYNLFQSVPCPVSSTDIVAEPFINLLGINGGPTLTHSLQDTSPAINGGHPVSNFSQFDAGNFGQLQTQGFTDLDAGALFLAGGVFNVGSAFVTNPIDPGQSFSAQFQFEIVPDAGGGADGFTFTISDDPTDLGQAGGFLGIGASDPIEPFPAVIGVVNGVSVEFDTWLNGQAEGANDPDLDHVGIDINGNLSSVALTALGPHGTLTDGNVWTAWVDYDSVGNALEVRTSNTGIRPALATVSTGVDIESLTGPVAYVGFTGSTGSAGISGQQRILNFSFSGSCESTDQRGGPRPESTRCDIGAYEASEIPLALGTVTLSTYSPDQPLDDGQSYPGVVDVPIINIPIEKLTGDTFNSPESAPLGSFPLGSFPIGSFDLRNSPMGSFPLGSFPLGSFPLGSFPLGSFPLSSIPLLDEGGWSEILDDIPELADAPLQAVTLEQLLAINPIPESVASIALRDLSIQGSPLGSFSMPSLSLGDTTVSVLDDWAENADPGNAETICETLAVADPPFTDCITETDTLIGLEVKGAPVSALSLSTLPLGSFPIGSFPLGSFPIGSFPLGSFPLGSFPLGSFPLGSFPLGSFPLGSFPLGSFNLLAAPLGSFPLGSFPLGSFPLGSFEIDGRSFCEFFDEQTPADESDTCALLGLDPGHATLEDVVQALADNGASNIGSTPLGSFPLGSFPIGSFPLGSFSIETVEQPPLSLLTLNEFSGCDDLESPDCTTLESMPDETSLVEIATAYGGLAASPLGSFPIGSFDVSNLPMGSFPLGSFEINGTPLGSFPLGSFDLVTSPLGSFPIGSFPQVIDDPTGICSECRTLADASLEGVIRDSATLADLSPSTEFDNTTFGEILDAMTLAMLYGSPGSLDEPDTLGEIEDTGNLTLGQLLIAMMLKTDFPWETIPLDQLDPQAYSADHEVAYSVEIPLNGTEDLPVSTEVTLSDSFFYVPGSARLQVETRVVNPSESINDPVIVDNGDGTQTLVFNLTLGGFSTNTVSFKTVPALALGSYAASATVQLGSDLPVSAENSAATVEIIPDLLTDASEPADAYSAPANVLTLGFIDKPDDNDFFKVAPSAKGDRVAVFMSNPVGDNDLIMYEPFTSVEARGQSTEAAPLDSVPFEDDGIDYEGNLTEEPNALEDVNLRDARLASISTNRDDIDESVSAIADSDEPFVIQVSGYNGAVSNQPYTLRVKSTPEVPSPQCSARSWPGTASATVPVAGEWTANTNAVFLVNGSRLASSDPGGAVAADGALSAINNLVNAAGIIDGVVVDVSDIYDDVSGTYVVDKAYDSWDLNPCDADAANNIVNAITGYLEEQRAISPRLTYVTIVGSDEVIPFARKPDETSIANESTFAGEFADNAMYGALVTRHFLSDDTYGDFDPIPWMGRYLNVPELAVGRLVESAEDIVTAAENYIDFGGVLDPQTALSAGYDFIADSSQDIDDTLNEYGPVLGFSVEPALIDPPGITPETDAWSKLDFIKATNLDKRHPVELVSFNMHFDFDEALPSIGDATGNYTDNLIHASDLEDTHIAGGIWYTVGCHSGTNVPDVSVMAGAPSQDWAQSFNHLGALYLAQNAYGLGDTEAIALTERLMADFTRNLSGSLTIGQAHAFAKQQYFANLGLYGEYDFKALQAATLFGLPMYRFGNGASVVLPTPEPLPISIDPISGLASASWSLAETGISRTETSKGSLFSVDGDVQFVHFRPLQPIVRRDVTSPDGETAGGAFLTQLTTEDIEVQDIAFARPVIDLGENEPEIETDEVVFPTVFTNIAGYKAPPPGGGPFEPRDQLNVIVGQFTSPADGANHGTERLFRDFETQIFYRPGVPAQPALAAPLSSGGDYLRPEFDDVQASVVGSETAPQAAFSVDVMDNGDVLRVAVLYLQSVTGTPSRGNWVLVDLVPGPGGTTWTGGGPVDPSVFEAGEEGEIDYMVQAVDDSGNVANSTFKGLFYVAKPIPAPPDGTDPEDPFEVLLSDPDNPGDYLHLNDWNPVDSIQVDIVTDGMVTYEYSVDGNRPLLPLTPDGFVVSEDGIHIVDLFGSDGSHETFVLLIDNTPAEIVIATPAEGAYVVQGMALPAEYVCRDSGSGTASCVGDVAVGDPVPDSVTGAQEFSVNATDNTGLESGETNSYFVVQALEIDAPTEPVQVNTAVSITVTATDLDGIDEHMTIDWGDGAVSSSDSPSPADVTQNGGLFTASHVYAASGTYPVTATIEYDGGTHVQTSVYEFVAVYDPRGGLVTKGFVTGAGWIDSPPGAYTPNDDSDPDLVDKSHFNISSKYKKGKSTPQSSTSFRVDGTGLMFESTSYDWLVVEGDRARYQGVGTISGEDEPYRFQVTALDSDIPESSAARDGFRIKIWQDGPGGTEFVLYDNGLGADSGAGSDATTTLGGGTITVHKANGN